MWEGLSSATTRSRPIINARDEPHADAEKYRRLHVIVGDSSMLQATTELKVGTAILVLDLIESGVPMGDRSLRHPIRDIRMVSRDLTGRTALESASGGATSALALQSVYLEHATRLVERGDHSLGDDAVAHRVIDRWRRMIEALEAGDTSPMAGEIDWVLKKTLMDRYLARSGADWDDPRLTRLDVAYHDITPGVGLLGPLAASGRTTRVVDDEAITAARSTPPATTRAALRGRFVEAGPRGAPRFHGRLGASAAQRSIASCGRPQGSVRAGQRTRGSSDRRPRRRSAQLQRLSRPGTHRKEHL